MLTSLPKYASLPVLVILSGMHQHQKQCFCNPFGASAYASLSCARRQQHLPTESPRQQLHLSTCSWPARNLCVIEHMALIL